MAAQHAHLAGYATRDFSERVLTKEQRKTLRLLNRKCVGPRVLDGTHEAGYVRRTIHQDAASLRPIRSACKRPLLLMPAGRIWTAEIVRRGHPNLLLVVRCSGRLPAFRLRAPSRLAERRRGRAASAAPLAGTLASGDLPASLFLRNRKHPAMPRCDQRKRRTTAAVTTATRPGRHGFLIAQRPGHAMSPTLTRCASCAPPSTCRAAASCTACRSAGAASGR